MSTDNDNIVKLVADIGAHNAAEAAHIRDALIESHKHDAWQLANALLDLYDTITKCQVIDRRLLEAQYRVSVNIDLAGRIVADRSYDDGY